MTRFPAMSLNLTLMRSVVSADGAQVVSISIEYEQFPGEAWRTWEVGWSLSAAEEVMVTIVRKMSIIVCSTESCIMVSFVACMLVGCRGDRSYGFIDSNGGLPH